MKAYKSISNCVLLCFLIFTVTYKALYAAQRNKESPEKIEAEKITERILRDAETAYSLLQKTLTEVSETIRKLELLTKKSKACASDIKRTYYYTKSRPKTWGNKLATKAKELWSQTKTKASSYFGRKPNKHEQETKKAFDELPAGY